MTVTDLIAQLQALQADGHGETEVAFAYNYGDYWNTQVAATVERLEPAAVEYSLYHSMDKVVEQEEDEDGEIIVAEDTRTVILLG